MNLGRAREDENNHDVRDSCCVRRHHTILFFCQSHKHPLRVGGLSKLLPLSFALVCFLLYCLNTNKETMGKGSNVQKKQAAQLKNMKDKGKTDEERKAAAAKAK